MDWVWLIKGNFNTPNWTFSWIEIKYPQVYFTACSFWLNFIDTHAAWQVMRKFIQEISWVWVEFNTIYLLCNIITLRKKLLPKRLHPQLSYVPWNSSRGGVILAPLLFSVYLLDLGYIWENHFVLYQCTYDAHWEKGGAKTAPPCRRFGKPCLWNVMLKVYALKQTRFFHCSKKLSGLHWAFSGLLILRPIRQVSNQSAIMCLVLN